MQKNSNTSFLLKRIVPIVTLLISAIICNGQELIVKSFSQKVNDIAASINLRTDNNGDACALVKVQLAVPGAKFEPNVIGTVEYKTNEYWVYLPTSISKHLKVKHPNFLITDVNFADYGIDKLEPKTTYELVLAIPAGISDTPIVTSQYLIFTVEPADAVVEVNGEMWNNTGGNARKYVNFGTYEYRIYAQDYHTETGKIVVDDPKNKHLVNVKLSPNYGWIDIAGEGEMQGSSVYINGNYVGKAPIKSGKLKSGTYEVKIVTDKYEPFVKSVTVTDDNVTKVSPSLVANFSNITLKVDNNAEIWVNDEKKGYGSWNGDLSAGTYRIECKKANHETSLLVKDIDNQMGGQVIQLQAPKPINGSLMVESNPDFATLVIDGKKFGETPMQINAILIGEHTLHLEKDGYSPVDKTFTIEKGKTLTLKEELQSGHKVFVKTDREGDKVFVDNKEVGKTPYTAVLGFGWHTLKVKRGSEQREEKINILPQGGDQLKFFEFGKMVHIDTDHEGDEISIDGKKVGQSPLDIDLPYGSRHIHAQRGKKYADVDLDVFKSMQSGRTIRLVLHEEDAKHFVERGVNFITLNAASDINLQPSYGVSFGTVKKTGWFASVMSNYIFDAMLTEFATDESGCVDGAFPNYNGEISYTRISVMGGLMAQIDGPIYGRIGAGFGSRVLSQNTNSGQWVKQTNKCFTGIDVSAGLQLNLKGLSVSLDAVSTNFKTLEIKLGLGFCWKKK